MAIPSPADISAGAPRVAALGASVIAGDRTALGRAITLVESTRADHVTEAAALIEELLPHTGGSHRIGITGVPGVGKSTFIDQFGMNLVGAGHRVAVLAVDPTSRRTGGAILGDKTRMARLSVDQRAFVRPSPAGATLGGVTRTTRETMLLCEAAGFDVVIVETVGVGQSETIVADMVDVFVVLMLSGAGDELQGIKKGVLELADLIAVNKADGDNVTRARLAVSEYRHALQLTQPVSPNWSPPVLTCSSTENVGLDEIWTQLGVHRDKLTATGELAARRAEQQVRWMWNLVDERLRSSLRSSPAVAGMVDELSRAVSAGEVGAFVAAERILAAYEAN